MKKLTMSILGISLLSGALLAHGGNSENMMKDKKQEKNSNHMGDHMHNGKMMNHGNSDGMTDKQIHKMKNKKHEMQSNDVMKN